MNCCFCLYDKNTPSRNFNFLVKKDKIIIMTNWYFLVWLYLIFLLFCINIYGERWNLKDFEYENN